MRITTNQHWIVLSIKLWSSLLSQAEMSMYVEQAYSCTSINMEIDRIAEMSRCLVLRLRLWMSLCIARLVRLGACRMRRQWTDFIQSLPALLACCRCSTDRWLCLSSIMTRSLLICKKQKRIRRVRCGVVCIRAWLWSCERSYDLSLQAMLGLTRDDHDIWQHVQLSNAEVTFCRLRLANKEFHARTLIVLCTVS